MVLVLRRHVGEDDPSDTVCQGEEDCSQRQKSVKPPFQTKLLDYMIKFILSRTELDVLFSNSIK